MFPSLAQLSFLSLLLPFNVVFASQFRFNIQEIYIDTPVDLAEDDLTLALVATTGSKNFTQSYIMGSFGGNETIKWENLTLNIDLPKESNNFSVAFGLFNNANQRELDTTSQFANAHYRHEYETDFPKELFDSLLNSAVSILKLIPIPGFSIVGGILDSLLKVFNFLGCDGPAALGNSTYSAADLEKINQNDKSCKTETYLYKLIHPVACGIERSNYTVTYCLERLDAKGSAANILPKSYFYVAAVGLSLFAGFSL